MTTCTDIIHPIWTRVLRTALWSLLLMGCWSTVSAPAAGAATDFVVFGDEGIWVREGSTVVSGDVGANVASAGPWLASDQEVTFGINVIVQDPMSQVMGDTMRLKTGSMVHNVFVNTLRGPGVIQGTITTPVTLPLVAALPPVPPVTPGTQDFDVPSGGTLSLDAGNYGILKARNGAVVTLTGGVYHFQSWNIRANAQVLAVGPVEIRVQGHLETRDHVVLGPAPSATSLTAAHVVIIGTGINGSTGAIDATPEAVRIGTDSSIRANIYAPNGLLRIRKNGSATGAFVGKWVRMGNGGTITLEGGFGLGIGGDTIPPVVTTPGNIVVPADHSSGTFISHPLVEAFLNGATAVDNIDGVLEVFPDSPHILPLGQNLVTFSAIDAAGNIGTATAVITVVDQTVPAIVVEEDILVESLNSNGIPISDVNIQRFLNGSRAIDNVDGELSLTHDAPAVFPFGVTTVTFSATDSAGNTGVETAVVTVADTTPPVFSITSPSDLQVFTSSPITLTGTIDDPMATLQVNGTQGTVSGGTFTVNNVPVQEGQNTLAVVANDPAGNSSQSVIQVSLVNPPVVTITNPTNMSVVNAETLNVTGTVDTGGATVSVNGIAASVSGGSFTASGVPIRDGVTILTAEAINAAGSVGTTMVQVIRDAAPPRVNILSPGPGEVVTTPTVTVSGTINDNVVGTIHGDNMTVMVNGQAAAVANRSFVATNVPVSLGSNTLTVIATDLAGNMGQVSSSVTREAATGQSRILIESGNLQTGGIGNVLLDPLVVQVFDANGSPVENQQVIFRVKENNGTISTNVEQKRALVTTTDSQGFAQVSWTLGSRTGAANNRVETTAVGFAGKAVFLATALAGSSDKINVDAGNNQVGLVGQTLARPFVAIVTDVGHNRLANIPVTFSVVEGGGHFNGQSSVTTMTDNDGRALAALTSGFQEGIDNNRVRATFPGNIGFPASFTASGRVAGDPSATQISGVVFDNTDQPIPGVTLTVAGTALTTQSDAQGQFVLTPVPVGTVHLLADGSTAQRPGTWPNLEYELVTLPGQDNTLGMPIYLLPLDIPNGLFVDQTTGGTLTLPQVPGFALTIEPGAATFPNGSQSGTVSVTVVHSDKVPMTPNFGQQPRFIITIQPPGVHFEPPAAMTMPNTDGLAPGQITELYSFDHDLGQFVSIGTGTVSEDGTKLVSDPGVGIVKGGWHCGGDPASTGSAGSCEECKICDGDECVIDPAKDGNNCSKEAGAQKIACCAGGDCGACEKDDACEGIIHVCIAGQGCNVSENSPTDCEDDGLCGTNDDCENSANGRVPMCEYPVDPLADQLRDQCLFDNDVAKGLCVLACFQNGECLLGCNVRGDSRKGDCNSSRIQWIKTCVFPGPTF